MQACGGTGSRVEDHGRTDKFGCPAYKKKTVEAILDSGNHYLIQVKRNQPSLFAQMSELLLDKPMDIFEESERGHGRHSHWTVSVHDASESPKAAEWPGLSRLIHVHKQKLDTATGQLTHSDKALHLRSQLN